MFPAGLLFAVQQHGTEIGGITVNINSVSEGDAVQIPVPVVFGRQRPIDAGKSEVPPAVLRSRHRKLARNREARAGGPQSAAPPQFSPLPRSILPEKRQFTGTQSDDVPLLQRIEQQNLRRVAALRGVVAPVEITELQRETGERRRARKPDAGLFAFRTGSAENQPGLPRHDDRPLLADVFQRLQRPEGFVDQSRRRQSAAGEQQQKDGNRITLSHKNPPPQRSPRYRVSRRDTQRTSPRSTH